MGISRRKFMSVVGSAALGVAVTPVYAAETFNWQFGHGFPSTHPLNVRAVQVAARIKKETGGRLNISVFPNSQLGGDTDLLSQVHSGAIDMFSTGGIIMSTLVPGAGLSGVGFAFSNYQAVWSAMDGSVGEYVRGAFAKKGLHALDKVWDNGFRETTTSTKPIRTPADFVAMKIRVPVSPLYVSLFKALKASPTGINLKEVYTALQTGVVDGQENPLVVTDTTKFYEVQKYCSLTNHIWDGIWIVVNAGSWQALPADLQKVVSGAFNEMAPVQRDDIAKLNASLQGSLQKKGLKFNEVDVAPFQEEVRKAGFYNDWKKKFGAQAWDALEASAGQLT